jgi:hypothetical protein
LELLPWDRSVSFIRQNNFAGFSFKQSRLDDLYRFLDRCRDPSFEFIDSELETLRSKLSHKIDGFTNTIATETFYVQGKDNLSTVPPEWEAEQPNHFWQVVNALHQGGKEIGEIYDELVCTGRRKLV